MPPLKSALVLLTASLPDVSTIPISILSENIFTLPPLLPAVSSAGTRPLVIILPEVKLAEDNTESDER